MPATEEGRFWLWAGVFAARALHDAGDLERASASLRRVGALAPHVAGVDTARLTEAAATILDTVPPDPPHEVELRIHEV